MNAQYLTLEISANTVAWYGAIVATLSIGILLYNTWRDRAVIEIRYQKNMIVSGGQSIYPADKTYFNVSVINKGRRPVNITRAGYRTFGRERKFGLFCDSFSPHRNKILTEESPITEFFVEQDEEVLKSVWYICVYDATGREYRKYLHAFPALWGIWQYIKIHWLKTPNSHAGGKK